MQKLKLNKQNQISYSIIIFSAISFLFIYFFTNIYFYLWYPPQGIHFSRQTDSLSFSTYFYLTGNHIFEPGNLNLDSSFGKCAAEFPIIYYFTSILYDFFGYNFYIHKSVTIVFLFIGFLFCNKSIFLLGNSIITTVFLSILFFSSTVILYYGSLYLPDIPAFSLTIVGFYFFLLYQKNQIKKDLVFMFFFLTLSSLIKASFYYYEFVFFIVIILNLQNKKIKSNLNILCFFISSVIIFSWYYYAILYNNFNHANHYSTSPVPFWKDSKERIMMAYDMVLNYWYSKYYFQSTMHFFLVTILVYTIFIKKNLADIILILLLLLSTCIYFSLFLVQFIDHDYYFIVNVPFIIITISIFYFNIEKRIKNIYMKFITTLFLITLSLLSLNYAKLNLHRRYTNNIDSFSVVGYQLSNVNKFLDSLKIKKDAKFIVIGDKTKNGSLVFLNKFGWTYENFNHKQTEIIYNFSNADYLVVLSPSKNRIPKIFFQKLYRCKKYNYLNNDIYSLKKQASTIHNALFKKSN